MKTLAIIILLTLISIPCRSQEIFLKEHPYKQQTSTAKYKKERKQLYVDKWINDNIPNNKKPKFIEFWATWCGPCISFLPKYNQLQENYGGQIDFITISNESLEKVSKFLDKKEIKGFVALDDNNKTWEEFKIQGIPQTFLLDKNGIVQWQGHPSDLEEEKLKKLSSGIEFSEQFIQPKGIALTGFIESEFKDIENRKDSLIINMKSDSISLFLVRSRIDKGGWSIQANKSSESPSIAIIGGTLKSTITFLNNESFNRVITTQPLGKDRYDLKVSSNSLSYDEMIRKAIPIIEQRFNIKIEETTAMEEVYYASIIDENKYKTQNSYTVFSKYLNKSGSSSDTSLKLKNRSLNDFVRSVELDHKVLIDLSFDADKTCFSLDLVFDNVNEMFKQVEEQIGVRFVKGERPTKILQISKI